MGTGAKVLPFKDRIVGYLHTFDPNRGVVTIRKSDLLAEAREKKRFPAGKPQFPSKKEKKGKIVRFPKRKES